MKINVKLIVFGIDDNYNVYVLLDKNNELYTKEITDDSPKSLDLIVSGLFLSLLGFDSNFTKVYLSSVDLSDVLSIYYVSHIPTDTFNNERYKWVKVNETTYTDNGDNRTKLSMESYKAIRHAMGQRKYEDYACRTT